MTLIEILSELRKETKRINEAVAAIEKLIKVKSERRDRPPAVSPTRSNNPK